MRLLHSTTMQMKVWHGTNIPPYIILSHRWEDEEDEVTLEDFTSDTAVLKLGYHKISKLCKIARKYQCEWVWLDTCCIDKRNSVELNEAINSMYKWYQNSLFCVAYLFDYRSKGHTELRDSTWFKRCWTLQELISPRVVRFYDKDWRFFGTKQELCREIAKITGVDEDTLSGADPRRCSVAQRMSWAAGREATRIEDQAYSLLGLFDLSLPMLYGDGEKAFLALQKEILLYSGDSNDQSIFAWNRAMAEGQYYGLLAKNARCFAGCGATRCTPPISKTYAFSFTGAGFQLNVPAIPYGMNTYLCPLDCTSDRSVEGKRDCILLERSVEDDQYARVCRNGVAIVGVKIETLQTYQRRIYVPQLPRHVPVSMVHGFLVKSIQICDYTSSEIRKVQLRSRDTIDIGPVSLPSVLAIPMTEWGTAGFIHFPQPKSVFHKEQIRMLKLGFDEDFAPRYLLANNSTMSDPGMKAENFFDRSVQGDTTRWSNSWLCEEGRPPSGMQLVTLDTKNELPKQRGDKDSPDGAVTFGPWGYMKIRCSLQTCPRDVKVASLPKCGPGPWKIWTIDIYSSGSFYEDRQARRQRRQQTALVMAATVATFAVDRAMTARRREREEQKRIEMKEREKADRRKKSRSHSRRTSSLDYYSSDDDSSRDYDRSRYTI